MIEGEKNPGGLTPVNPPGNGALFEKGYNTMAKIKLSQIRASSKRHLGVKTIIEMRDQPYAEIVKAIDALGLAGGGAHWYKWVQANCEMEDGSDIVPVVDVPRKRAAKTDSPEAELKPLSPEDIADEAKLTEEDLAVMEASTRPEASAPAA